MRLEASWRRLGFFWAYLGASWPVLEASWGDLGGVLGAPGAVLGRSWRDLPFQRFPASENGNQNVRCSIGTPTEREIWARSVGIPIERLNIQNPRLPGAVAGARQPLRRVIRKD